MANELLWTLGVTGLTKSNQVFEPVSFFVSVFTIYAKRRNVVNLKRPFQFVSVLSAILTDIIISFSCMARLLLPVRSIVRIIAASPRRMFAGVTTEIIIPTSMRAKSIVCALLLMIFSIFHKVFAALYTSGMINNAETHRARTSEIRFPVSYSYLFLDRVIEHIMHVFGKAFARTGGFWRITWARVKCTATNNALISYLLRCTSVFGYARPRTESSLIGIFYISRKRLTAKFTDISCNHVIKKVLAFGMSVCCLGIRTESKHVENIFTDFRIPRQEDYTT